MGFRGVGGIVPRASEWDPGGAGPPRCEWTAEEETAWTTTTHTLEKRTMRRRILAVGATLALTAMMVSSTTAFARQTPVDKVVACVDEAANQFVDCIEMNRWYWAWPCTWRYEANVILCLPAVVLGAVK
jgi:hypothetical protein